MAAFFIGAAGESHEFDKRAMKALLGEWPLAIQSLQRPSAGCAQPFSPGATSAQKRRLNANLSSTEQRFAINP